MITVDLFSGVGGLSLGLMNAGFDVVASFDFWDKAVENYNLNFDHPCHQFDLSDYDGAAARVSEYKPQIIVGGPPCQEFSQAGTRQEGAKANLTACYAKTVTAVRPEWFMMENVERAQSSNAYKVARDIFKEAGYGLSENVMLASLCGVPQARKRFFCVGKLGEEDGFLDGQIQAALAPKPMTLRDYFGTDLGVAHYYRHPRSYARRGVFSIDEPSPTIRGVNRPVPGNYPGHSGDTADYKTVGPLTTSQRAQVQTFPANFVWQGTKTNVEQMIGNAVPVNLGAYMGEAINRFIADPVGSRAMQAKPVSSTDSDEE